MLSWKWKACVAGTSCRKQGSMKIVGGKQAYKEDAVRSTEDYSRKKDRKSQVWRCRSHLRFGGGCFTGSPV